MMSRGVWKIFLCTQICFLGLLQKHKVYFVVYSVIGASGVTQKCFFVGFLLSKI